MIAGVGGTVLISVIATCVSSFYYCSKVKEYLRKGIENANIRDEVNGECADCIQKEFRVGFPKEDRTEGQSKNSRSSIVNEQQADTSEEYIAGLANKEKIPSTEERRRTMFPLKRSDVVPVRPPRRRRRREISRTSDDVVKDESSVESRYSSTKKGSTDTSIDTSTVTDNEHTGDGVKRVTAQIEYHPRGIASPSKEILNSLESQSSPCRVNSTSKESTLMALGERSSVMPLDAKNDYSEKVKTRKTINTVAQCEDIETEESTLTVPSRLTSQYPPGTNRSMMFQINRMVNASTSTKISSHAQELKEFDSEQIASVPEICTGSSCSAEEYSITILKEVLSFLSHEEKDCALEVSTSRTNNGEEASNVSQENDSRIITIQIRKYHGVKDGDGFADKSKSFESRLMKMYGKLSGRAETEYNEESSSSSRSKKRSKTRLSTIDDSTNSLSSMDRSSYYTIRLSEIDQAIFQKKSRKKEKSSRIDGSKKLSKIFQCSKCV